MIVFEEADTMNKMEKNAVKYKETAEGKYIMIE